MRKIPTIMTLAAIVSLAVSIMAGAQNLNVVSSDQILASAFGDRNSTTLNSLVSQIGTRQCSLVLDGGSWTVTNNVSFPTNVTLVVTRGARLDIGTGKMVSILGDFVCGHYPAFSGAGTATGPARFVYRIPEWGDTTAFDIGDGDLLAASTNASYAVLMATTGSFTYVSTDYLTVNQWLHGLSATVEVYQVNTTNLFVTGTARIPAVDGSMTVDDTVSAGTNVTDVIVGRTYPLLSPGISVASPLNLYAAQHNPIGHGALISASGPSASAELYGPEYSRSIDVVVTNGGYSEYAGATIYAPGAVMQWIPRGVSVKIRYQSGTYTANLADIATKSPTLPIGCNATWFGGGDLTFQASNYVYSTGYVPTNCAVVLDLSQVTDPVANLSWSPRTNIPNVVRIVNSQTPIYFQGIHFKANTSSTNRNSYGNNGVVSLNNCKDVYFDQCIFEGTGKTNVFPFDGFEPSGIEVGASKVRLENCTFRNAGSSAIYAHDNSIVTVKNCTSSGSATSTVSLYAESSIIFKQGTVPTGTSSNEYKMYGGQIF